MKTNKTESELLFEIICNKRKIEFEPILRNDKLTPDYFVKIGGIEIVIEVKQLDPNKDDKKGHDQVFLGKKTITFFLKNKSRVREKIKSASKQLRKYSRGIRPAIIVLFDNTRGFSGLNGYGILTGMYGDERIPILVDECHELEPIAGPTRFGGGRKMTDKENKYISALGIIKIENGEPELDIFHNVFADIPLNKSIASLIARKQYMLPEGDPNTFREWEEIL